MMRAWIEEARTAWRLNPSAYQRWEGVAMARWLRAGVTRAEAARGGEGVAAGSMGQTGRRRKHNEWQLRGGKHRASTWGC